MQNTTTTQNIDTMTAAQILEIYGDRMTGFGLRRIAGCDPVDTVRNKLAAGALTGSGVRRLIAEGQI